MTGEQLAFGVDVTASAVIDGPYRYELTRRWDEGLPLLEWIMLNPSTADALADDPTIRRCVGFAKAWGYGSIVVHNLYAYRATDPAELANVPNPIGPRNRDYLAASDAARTIVAWGAHPAAVGWWNGYPYDWQRSAIRRSALWCLGINANGSPKHPLYVPKNADLRPWPQRSNHRKDNECE